MVWYKKGCGKFVNWNYQIFKMLEWNDFFLSRKENQENLKCDFLRLSQLFNFGSLVLEMGEEDLFGIGSECMKRQWEILFGKVFFEFTEVKIEAEISSVVWIDDDAIEAWLLDSSGFYEGSGWLTMEERRFLIG